MIHGPLYLLIVEDDEAHVIAIRRAFEAAAPEVEIQSVATLREFHASVLARPPDLTLMDLNLPDGSAMEALTHPPQDAPFPILVMTAFGNQQIVVDVMKAGALDYVVKSPESFASMPHTVERVLREWELLQQQQQAEVRIHALVEMVNAAPLAILVHDFAGKFLYANLSALAIHQYSEPEFMALNLCALDVPASAALVQTRLEQIAKDGHATFEVGHFRKDGSVVPLELFVKQVTWLGQAALLSIGSDITARKQAERKMRHMLKDLERSNKELEQFANIASHDLQEPLRMVSSYTQLLALRYEGQLDDKAKKYIDYAVEGAIRMQRIINDLLEYSRAGKHGKPIETTDMHSVIGEAINSLDVVIKETKAVITNENLPVVSADASQLVQMFQNLLANAIKFRGADLPRIHVAARDDGSEWVFSVRDNGIGIEPQHADKVFVIFQRLHTREEYPGTGIGLAVCKRIAERHDGRIWFESEPGKGTTFFFTIPK